MRISFIFTMASAIFLTAFLIYIHTYICYGQQSIYNQNLKKQHGLPSLVPQNKPDTCFLNNLTDGGINKGISPHLQKLFNAQNLMQQTQQIDVPQTSPLQQSIASQQLQPSTTQTTSSCNAPAPQVELSQPGQNYQVSQSPMLRPIQATQFPMQYPALPTQYSIQPQFTYPQFQPNSGLTSQNYVTPSNVPVSVETPQSIFNMPQTSFMQKPAYTTYYPMFEPNQNVLIGNPTATVQHNQVPGYISQSIPPYRVTPSYPMNTVVAPEYQGSQSSSLKMLLPIILNLLKEKNNCNSCTCSSCNCDCKNCPTISSSYSKQKKYHLSEDGPEIEDLSEEIETVRKVREPKTGKLKNIIPDESEETDSESLEHQDDDEE